MGAHGDVTEGRDTQESVCVVLADRDIGTRLDVREALEAGGFVIVAEATDGSDVIRVCEEHLPQVVLLDVHLSGNGIQTAREVTHRHPQIAVVMLAESAEEDDLFDSLRAGAAGYLLRDTNARALCAALRGVLTGEAALSRTMVTRVVDEFRGPSKRRFARSAALTAQLSPREWEIMQLLAAGQTTDQVARELFVSQTTVRVHVSTALKKLRVPDRKSALRLLRGE